MEGFQRLARSSDPAWQRMGVLLQFLCEASSRYQQTSKHPSKQQQQHLPQRLSLLKATSDCLEQLHHALLQHTKKCSPAQTTANIEFVTLPVRATLRVCGEAAWDESSSPVEQSAQWNCLRLGCRVLTTCLEHFLNGDSNRPPHNTDTLLLSCLTICSLVLPSGAHVVATKTTTRTDRLEHGQECLRELLVTIRAAVLRLRPIVLKEQTPLFTRILDTVVAVVEPPPPMDTTGTLQHDPFSSVRSVALELMQAMIRVVVDPLVWYPVFPGVYTSLYRRIFASLRLCHAKTAEKKVVLESLQVLSSFLSRTLSSNNSIKKASHNESALDKLQRLSKGGDHALENTKDTAAVTRDDEDPFVWEAEKRLPSTLSALLLAVTAARSATIRKQSLSLVNVLLGDCHLFWRTDSVSDQLATEALESCLLLCRDNDDIVVTEATVTLKTFMGNDQCLYVIKTLLAPRIQSLLARIPLLVESSREKELQRTLRVLAGVVVMARVPLTKEVKRMHSYLLGELADAHSLKKSVLPIFNSMMTSVPTERGTTQLKIDARGEEKALDLHGNTSDHLVVLHDKGSLCDETMVLAETFVQSVGNVIGPRHAAALIDEWLAELYESAVRRASLKLSFAWKSQVVWLQDWYGVLKLVKGIFAGAYSVSVGDGMADRVLVHLVESVLPLLLTHPLWTLPTKPPVADESGVTCVSALKGNTLFLLALMDVIETIVDLLGSHVSVLVNALLVPFFEKAGFRNAPAIRDRSVVVLKKVATKCGHDSLSQLVAVSFESDLMEQMQRKLRIPNGKLPKKGDSLDDSVISVMEMASTVFRVACSAKSNDGSGNVIVSIVPSMELLTEELTSRFDQASMKSKDGVFIALQLLSLYDSAMVLLRQQEIAHGIERNQNSPGTDKWFGLLSLYRSQLVSESHSSLTDGFSRNQKMLTNPSRDCEFVSTLAWRCSYLLSHSSLEVRIRSCMVLQQCFEFLGWVHRIGAAQDGEANGPKTAVLRQVHSSWSPISLRMKSLVSELYGVRSTSLVLVSSEEAGTNVSDLSDQRINLAQLLDLVASMTMASGDFMAGRL